MNKTLTSLCLPLLLAVTISACGNDDPQSEGAGAPVAVAPSSAPAVPTPSASAPAVPTPSASAPAAGSSRKEVTESAARATALKAAGAGATVRKVERDDEDGRQVFKFDITVGNGTRKISVDRETGRIVKDEKDTDTDTDTDNDG